MSFYDGNICFSQFNNSKNEKHQMFTNLNQAIIIKYFLFFYIFILVTSYYFK